MSLERTQSTGAQPQGPRAGSLELKDPRRRPCPPAPPPPRISDKIADKIKFLQNKSNPILEDDKASSSSQSDLGPSEVTQAQNGPGPGLDAAKSTASTGKKETPVKTGQLSGTPGRIESSRPSSPYSPSSPLRDEDEIAKDQNFCKIKANRSSEDVIESVSMLLKNRDDSLAKYRRNFRDLRKVYDAKKAELSVVQAHVKELRKQVESLSGEKKEVQLSLEKQVESLQEELRKVKGDLKAFEDEKEAQSTNESTKLQYTQAALEGQKLLAEMHNAKVGKLESENADLRKFMASQKAKIGLMSNRIKSLEAAIQEDVNDKNVMVGSFNLYMAKTQRRVEELFANNAEFMEDPRVEGYNVSCMSQASQLAIKGENGKRMGSNVSVMLYVSVIRFF